MRLEDLQVYQLAMDIAEKVWAIVNEWDYFSKDTVGKQLMKASDSIAANISEGYGRYFFKENKPFCFYARGSLQETKTWIRKAFNRNLIKEELHQELLNNLEMLSVKINNYIKTIGKIETNHNNE
jgi:four helix bundle protein